MMQPQRVVSSFLSLVISLFSLSTSASAQRPEPRLGVPITGPARVVLSGSRTPQARTDQDLGKVSPDMAVPGITLVFRHSAAQETALSALLAAQQDRASPLYHHWLTPEIFAAQFGVADQDIATTKNWLTSCGFQVDNVSRNRDRITFSGIASQVEAAFGTELHRYLRGGELHFAPASDLTLPAELASVTAAVLHLSDFRPKPNWRPLAITKPDFTSVFTQAHYLAPKDIFTMYDLNPLSNREIYGSGQGLAVVGQSFVNTSFSSSIVTFQANLTQFNPISPVLVPSSGVEAISPGDEGESEIDLEYSSGIAQNANIFLVYVGSNQNYSVFDALAFAITENLAPVVSISYGACEPLLSTSELDQDNALFEEAAAQGQTLVASSGDSGSTACAPNSSADGVTPTEQQELAVNFPASSPYVTAVGGTQMAAGTFTAGSSNYWAPASSIDNVNSLLSYVPEVVWNEGSAANGIISGGGGASAHFTRPAWQNSYPGVPAGTYRLVPDIALQSSIASPGFLLCTSDPALLNSEGQTSGCVDGLLANNNEYTIAGGTSFAAPIFAGFIALLNEAEHATGQGNINPELYALAGNSSSYASAFHDITSGNNACIAGAANCAAAGESAYAATVGYDEATGLGSIDFNALTATWPASDTAGLQQTSILITAPETASMPGETIPMQIYVSPLFSSAGMSTPTGGVSVLVDGTVVDSSLAFSTTNASDSQASVVYNFVSPSIPGSHLITVNYAGDVTHSPATSTYSVLVGNVLASGDISLTAGNLTIANGSSGSTEVTVTPSNGYTGAVVWSLAVTGGSSTSLTACYSIPSLPVNSLSTTKLTIGVGTACHSALPADSPKLRTLRQSSLMSPYLRGCWPAGPKTAIFASLMLFGCLTDRRRKLRLPLCGLILSLAIAGVSLIGCGGAGSNAGTLTTSPTSPSSSATSYIVTLTGKDSVNSSITASTTFTLTVN